MSHKPTNMKWVLVSSDHHQQVFELWDKDEKLFACSYHREHGTIRIISDEPRVFQLRKEGFLKTRTALLNEYGIKMVSIVEESDLQIGLIEADRKKFKYSIHNRIYKEVFIYEGENETPFITCDLPSHLNNYRVLLLLLCWYKLQPQKKEILQTA